MVRCRRGLSGGQHERGGAPQTQEPAQQAAEALSVPQKFTLRPIFVLDAGANLCENMRNGNLALVRPEQTQIAPPDPAY